MLIAVAAIATSCTDNSNVDAPSDGEVRITSGINTRVAGTSWDANDAIGVFMNSTSGTIGAYGANAEYVTTSGDGNFTSSSPLYFSDASYVDFLAYYPYVDDSSFDATAYSVNVSSQTDQSAIDLMTATATNIEKNAESVYMNFTHRLSSIKLSISTDGDWSASDLVGLTVKLTGTDKQASYNLSTNAIQLNGSVGDITLKTSTDGSSAVGIVIPQTLSGAKFEFTTASRGTVEMEINNAEFATGVQYTYNVVISATGATLLSTTINPWTEVTEDLGGSTASPESVVFDRAVLWNVGDHFDATEYGYSSSATGNSIDSAKQCYFMLLSSELYLDDDYYIAGTDNYFMKMRTAFVYDDDYIYTLGSYYFVDYEAVDANGYPEPYRIQACEFDADIYTAYFQDMVDGNFVSSSDYPYLRDNDSEMYLGVNEDSKISWYSSGFVATGGEKIELSSSDSPYYTVAYYNFNATFFGEPYAYGFKTETVDGVVDWVYPLVMEEMTTVNLTYGTSVYSAPSSQNAPKQLSGKVDRATFELQMQVTRLTMQPLATKIQDASFSINKK